MVILIHGIQEIRNPKSIEALRQVHSRSGGETEFQGSQSSAVPCLGNAVQSKRHGDSEEH